MKIYDYDIGGNGGNGGETLEGKCARLEESLDKTRQRETEKKARISTLEAQLKRYRTALEAIVVCASQKSIELCKSLAREALEEMDNG